MKNTVAVSAAALILSAGAPFAQTIVTQPSVEATEVQTDPQTTGSGAVGGATTGAVAGGIVGGPVGAAVGGLAGAALGDATEDALTPETRTYVIEHRVDSVTLDNVAVDTVVPETIQLQPIPDTQYQYVYVDDQPVIVEPQTRKIIHIVE